MWVVGRDVTKQWGDTVERAEGACVLSDPDSPLPLLSVKCKVRLSEFLNYLSVVYFVIKIAWIILSPHFLFSSIKNKIACWPQLSSQRTIYPLKLLRLNPSDMLMIWQVTMHKSVKISSLSSFWFFELDNSASGLGVDSKPRRKKPAIAPPPSAWW